MRVSATIRLLRFLGRALDYQVLCRRSKPAFLRKRGAVIGERCHLITKVDNFGTEPYLVRIGDDVTVTDGVKFITHDASTRVFRDRFPEMSPFGNVFGPVVIGHRCFVGVNAILLPNTVIGADSIVGAGAVVKGEFPPRSVIAGVPARRLCGLDEYIEKVRRQMVPLTARSQGELRRELLGHFFPEDGRGGPPP